MRPSILFTVIVCLLTTAPSTGQDFTFHSEDPFGIVVPVISGQNPVKTIFVDWDDDGDLDLFKFNFGLDTTFVIPNVFFLVYRTEYQENIGTPKHAEFGPIELLYEDFDRPGGFFFPTIGDLDNDGRLDMAIMGKIDTFGGFQHMLIYFGNGDPGEESFEMIIGDSLGLGAMTPRSMLFPELTDLDNDGDLDILLSGTTTQFGDLSSYERVVYYGKNFGTPEEPEFYGWFKNPYGLKQDTISEMMVAGDIDNDGDIDIVSLGSVAGETPLYVLEHEPDPQGKPSFLARVESPYGLPEDTEGIAFNSPALADIDDDGDLDFFITRSDSVRTMLFYENTLCQAVMTNAANTLCDGDTLTFGNQQITEAGEYTLELEQANGCDSIVNLTVSVIQPIQTDLEAAICEGETATAGGVVFDQPGIYEIILTAANGCDSVIIFTLEVMPVAEAFLSEDICEGETFVIGDMEFADGGNYQVTLTATNGCDSIINLELNVHAPSFTDIEADLCAGDVYSVAGEEITESGSYQFTIPGSNGCDSTISATLTFHEVNTEVQLAGNTLTAVLGDATYQWFDCSTGFDIEGAVQQEFAPTVSGIYAVRITDGFGCTEESDCIDVIVSAIDEPVWARSISIYPNPASNEIHISNRSGKDITRITFHMANGQSRTIEKWQNGHGIDISQYASGIVLVEMLIDTDRIIRKLVITNGE